MCIKYPWCCECLGIIGGHPVEKTIGSVATDALSRTGRVAEHVLSTARPLRRGTRAARARSRDVDSFASAGLKFSVSGLCLEMEAPQASIYDCFR